MFRDDQGHPTNHLGLQFQLSDFACEELTRDTIIGEDREIIVSTQELCQYLTAAEDKIRRQRQGTLLRHSISLGVKKRKRSETPPERTASDDEAKYAEREERAAKRMEDNDPDYENASGGSSLSN